MSLFKDIVSPFHQKIKSIFVFVTAIYQAQNFALTLPLHGKNE